MTAFVLDQVDNPHPRMLGEALLARASRFDSPEAMAYWLGYRAAMVAATGCRTEQIEGWLDHHDHGGTEGIGVPLPVRRVPQ